MELEHLKNMNKKENKIVMVRMSPEDRQFLKQHKISPTTLITEAIKELRMKTQGEGQ